MIWAMLAAGAAQDYRPAFDPSRLKSPEASPVLVLGTPHLAGWPKEVRPDLAPLLDRLAAFKPAIIAVESLSGPQCETLRRYRQRYTDTADSYCWDPAPARAATGLDVATATEEAERLLADWPAAPAPARRRHLAAVFLAAADQASALVQWLRLPLAERRAGDGLDAVLVARLEALGVRRNEVNLIAVPVAVRLGLDRIYPVDDHSADFEPRDAKAYGEALQAAWNNPAAEQRKAIDAPLMAGLGRPGGVLALYRAYNALDQPRLAYDGDFGAALKAGGYARQYAGWWETRNLRMVANIRDAIAHQPGARTLAIVGASHKGYYEAYLHQMHDVRLVDATAVLK